jgi:hypothetical protein
LIRANVNVPLFDPIVPRVRIVSVERKLVMPFARKVPHCDAAVEASPDMSEVVEMDDAVDAGRKGREKAEERRVE